MVVKAEVLDEKFIRDVIALIRLAHSVLATALGKIKEGPRVTMQAIGGLFLTEKYI